MILILHNFDKTTAIKMGDTDLFPHFKGYSIGKTVYELAKQYPNELLCWGYEKRFNEINFYYIVNELEVERHLHSFNSLHNYFPDEIGYVDQSPFIKINKNVVYPTWQMSAEVGVIRGKTVLLTDEFLWLKSNTFNYTISSIAKIYQSLGVFCYSNPNLLNSNFSKIDKEVTASEKELFQFVKEHYKRIWVHLLLLNSLLYDKKLFLKSWIKTINVKFFCLTKEALNFDVKEPSIDWKIETIDVVIPTIGRKKYLNDVLKDLSLQTHLPKNVIIVEQNSLKNSITELDYLTAEEWPFKIKHIFTHQTGACQARNKALELLESKWCFLADDDIRFRDDFIKNIVHTLIKNTIDVAIVSCLTPNQKKEYLTLSQTTIFGSGCAVCCSNKIKDICFNLELEFGFGEDIEFGMQLRNNGIDVIYAPDSEIIHLKAPMGGFRTKFIQKWENEKTQPKPAPTIMYVKEKYTTKKQLLGYKTELFFKTYSYKLWKVGKFQKQWNASLKWSKQL